MIWAIVSVVAMIVALAASANANAQAAQAAMMRDEALRSEQAAMKHKVAAESAMQSANMWAVIASDPTAEKAAGR